MTDDMRDKAPTAEEIERQFRSPLVLGLRPLLWAGMYALGFVRGYSWEGYFDEDLNCFDRPLIFAANHCSHADTAAILDTLPAHICKRTAVAAALDVFGVDNNNGFRRRISKACLQLIVAAGFHAFAFDRLGPPLRSVRTSVQLIRNGWNLLLFPEGTRSRTGEMAEFKAGVGVLARFTGRPVVPVHVEGGNVILPYGVMIPTAGRVIVRYGSPISYDPDESPADFAARLQDRVRELGERSPQPLPIAGPALNARLATSAPGGHHPY